MDFARPASCTWKDSEYRVLPGGSLPLRDFGQADSRADGGLACQCCAFHPSEPVLALGIDNTVVEIDSTGGAVLRRHDFPTQPTWVGYIHRTSSGWTPHPSLLVAFVDWSFRLVDASTGPHELVCSPRRDWSSKPFSDPLVSVSETAPFLVYALHGHTVPRLKRLVPLSALELEARTDSRRAQRLMAETKLRVPAKRPILGLAIHPGTGRHLLLLTTDGALRAYDLAAKTLEPVASLDLPPSPPAGDGDPATTPCNCLAFCPVPLGPEGTYVAACCVPGAAVLLLAIPTPALDAPATPASAPSAPRVREISQVQTVGAALAGVGFAMGHTGAVCTVALRSATSSQAALLSLPLRFDNIDGVNTVRDVSQRLVPFPTRIGPHDAVVFATDPKRLAVALVACPPRENCVGSPAAMFGKYGRPLVRANGPGRCDALGSAPHVGPMLWTFDLIPAWRAHCGSLSALVGSLPRTLAAWTSSEAVDVGHVGVFASEHTLLQHNPATSHPDVLCQLPDSNSQGRMHTMAQVVVSPRSRAALVFTEPCAAQSLASAGQLTMEFCALPLSDMSTPSWFAPGASGCFLPPDDNWAAVLDASLVRVSLHRRSDPAGPFAPAPLAHFSLQQCASPGALAFPEPPLLQPDLMSGPRSRGSRLMWVSRGRFLALSTDLADELAQVRGWEEGAPEYVSTRLGVDAALSLGPGEWVVQVVWQELGLEKDDELYAEIDALRRTSGSDSEGGRGGAGGEGDKAAALLEPDEQKGAAREVACVAAVLTNERVVIVDDHLRPLCNVALQRHQVLSCAALSALPISSIAWAGPVLLASTADGRVLQITWTGHVVSLCGAARASAAPVLLGATPDRLLLIRHVLPIAPGSTSVGLAETSTAEFVLGTPRGHKMPSAASHNGRVERAERLSVCLPGVARTAGHQRHVRLGPALVMGLASMGQACVVPVARANVRPVLRAVASAWDAASGATPDLLWALSDSGCADLGASIAGAAFDALGPHERAVAGALGGLWEDATNAVLEAHARALSALCGVQGSLLPTLHYRLLRSAGLGALGSCKFRLAHQCFLSAGDLVAAAAVAALRDDRAGVAAALSDAQDVFSPRAMSVGAGRELRVARTGLLAALSVANKRRLSVSSAPGSGLLDAPAALAEDDAEPLGSMVDWDAVVVDPHRGPTPAGLASLWDLAAAGAVPQARCLSARDVPLTVIGMDAAEMSSYVAANPESVFVLEAATAPCVPAPSSPRLLSGSPLALASQRRSFLPALSTARSGSSAGQASSDTGDRLDRSRSLAQEKVMPSIQMPGRPPSGSFDPLPFGMVARPRGPNLAERQSWEGSETTGDESVPGGGGRGSLVARQGQSWSQVPGSAAKGARLPLPDASRPPLHPPPGESGAARRTTAPAAVATPDILSLVDDILGDASTTIRPANAQPRHPLGASQSSEGLFSVGSDSLFGPEASESPRVREMALRGRQAKGFGFAQTSVGSTADARQTTGAARQGPARSISGITHPDAAAAQFKPQTEGSGSDSDSDDAGNRGISGKRIQVRIRAPGDSSTRTDEVARSRQLRSMVSVLSPPPPS